MNDQQVNSIINKRYNPEGEAINEDSRERTYDLSATNAFAEPQTEVNQVLQKRAAADESSMGDFTMADYTMVGGKKKKRKKKKKKGGKGNMSILESDLKPI